jgi:hypothetical protein
MNLFVYVCAVTDPTNMLKILIGPVICFILLLFVAGAGFVVFKKKYATPTAPYTALTSTHCSKHRIEVYLSNST